MSSLHRIGHQAEEFHLNPDLVVTVEANPDTVITLTTGTKIVVAESPERVVSEIRTYRVDVLSGALNKRRQTQGGDPQPHGIHARRAAQGMLLSIDRAETEAATEPPDQPA